MKQAIQKQPPQKQPFRIHGRWQFPIRIHDQLEYWINHGGDLSGFWFAMMSGDYLRAALNADNDNSDYFVQIMRFLGQDAPSACFGTPGKVRKWQARFEARGSK
jgi:hypothetical protein